MNQHPLTTVLINAVNRGAICFNDALYVAEVIALLEHLEQAKDDGVATLPASVVTLLERVKKGGEWI